MKGSSMKISFLLYLGTLLACNANAFAKKVGGDAGALDLPGLPTVPSCSCVDASQINKDMEALLNSTLENVMSSLLLQFNAALERHLQETTAAQSTNTEAIFGQKITPIVNQLDHLEEEMRKQVVNILEIQTELGEVREYSRKMFENSSYTLRNITEGQQELVESSNVATKLLTEVHADVALSRNAIDDLMSPSMYLHNITRDLENLKVNSDKSQKDISSVVSDLSENMSQLSTDLETVANNTSTTKLAKRFEDSSSFLIRGDLEQMHQNITQEITNTFSEFRKSVSSETHLMCQGLGQTKAEIQKLMSNVDVILSAVLAATDTSPNRTIDIYTERNEMPVGLKEILEKVSVSQNMLVNLQEQTLEIFKIMNEINRNNNAEVIDYLYIITSTLNTSSETLHNNQKHLEELTQELNTTKLAGEIYHNEHASSLLEIMYWLENNFTTKISDKHRQLRNYIIQELNALLFNLRRFLANNTANIDVSVERIENIAKMLLSNVESLTNTSSSAQQCPERFSVQDLTEELKYLISESANRTQVSLKNTINLQVALLREVMANGTEKRPSDESAFVNEINKMHQFRKDHLSLLDSVKDILFKINKTIGSISEKQQNFEEDYKNLKAEVTWTKRKLAWFDEEADTFRKNINDISQDTAKSLESSAALAQNVAAHEQGLSNLGKTISEMKHEIQTQATISETLEKHLNRTENGLLLVNGRLNTQREILQKNNREENYLRGNMKEIRRGLHSHIINASQINQKLQNDVSLLEKSHEKHDDILLTLYQNISQHNDTITTLLVDFYTMQKKIDKMSDITEQQIKRMEQTEASLTKLTYNVSTFHSSNHSLNQQNNLNTDTELIKKLEALTRNVYNVENNVSSLITRSSYVNETLEKMKGDLTVSFDKIIHGLGMLENRVEEAERRLREDHHGSDLVLLNKTDQVLKYRLDSLELQLKNHTHHLTLADNKVSDDTNFVTEQFKEQGRKILSAKQDLTHLKTRLSETQKRLGRLIKRLNRLNQSSKKLSRCQSQKMKQEEARYAETTVRLRHVHDVLMNHSSLLKQMQSQHLVDMQRLMKNISAKAAGKLNPISYCINFNNKDLLFVLLLLCYYSRLE